MYTVARFLSEVTPFLPNKSKVTREAGPSISVATPGNVYRRGGGAAPPLEGRLRSGCPALPTASVPSPLPDHFLPPFKPFPQALAFSGVKNRK